MDFARIIFSHHHLQHRRVMVLQRDYHDDNYNFLFPQHYANVAHLLALSGDWTLDLMFSIVHIGLDWIGVQAEWAAYSSGVSSSTTLDSLHSLTASMQPERNLGRRPIQSE